VGVCVREREGERERERDWEYQRLCFLEEIGDESGRFGRFFGREEFRSEVPENDHAYDSCEAEPSLRLLLPPLRCLAAFNCCRRRRHLRRRERERERKRERRREISVMESKIWKLILRVRRYMRCVLVKGKKKKEKWNSFRTGWPRNLLHPALCKYIKNLKKKKKKKKKKIKKKKHYTW